MVTNSILSLRDRCEAAKRRVLEHRRVAAITFVVGVYLGVRGFFYGDAPWTVIKLWFDWGLPRMTAANVGIFVSVAVAAVSAWVLLTGYYEQQARAMDRDRDCNLLSKQADDSKQLLRLSEMERDEARAKVIQLEQEAADVPLRLRQLRGELEESEKSRSQLALENLSLLTTKHQWSISIVIKFLDYADREMAEQLKKYLERVEPSWKVRPRYHSGDDLPRPKYDGSRMEFGSNKATSEFVGRLTWALERGHLRGIRVAHVSADADAQEIIGTIFPQSLSERVHG
jgi:hypothetical protein